MWGKVYEVTNCSDGPFDGATLTVWNQGTDYKLDVTNDGNGNNGSYADVGLISAGTGTDDIELVKFEEIDGYEFSYKKPKNDKGIIYVTPTGIAIVTE
jgi:hypothetical protein